MKASRPNSRLSMGADPLAAWGASREGESAADRAAREAEEKRVSDQIDRRLADEEKEKRKLARAGNQLEVLIVGATGAGKSTFVKQLRLTYDSKGLDAEREATRLVIILSICSTVRTLISLLEDDAADPSSSPSSSRPLSPNGQPRSAQEAIAVRRLRLAPLLGLEAPIREMLGAVTSGPSANSFAQQAILPVEGQLEYRDGEGSGPRSSSPELRRRDQVRSRAGSPATSEHDEPMLPQGFRERIGHLAFGNGKESRRAKAQQNGNGSMRNSIVDTSLNWTEDGKFVAHAEDPIHLVAALRTEIESLWSEAVNQGLVAGEGPLQGRLGGWEPSDSSRYFLDSLTRIATPTWLPSDADVLNVRVRTCGIETHFLQVTPTQSYRISDPAGARGVKHAWAPYFDGAAALIFVFDASAFNVCSPSDPTANRFADALDLFEDVATNSILKNVVIIAFLNKVDILRKKIKSGLYPLERYLPTYKGGTRSQEVLSHMQALVEHRHPKERKRPLYIFATQANDTKSIQMVVAAVNDILMRSTLAASGLL